MIGLDANQRVSLFSLVSAHGKTLEPDLSMGIEIARYWHIYFEKLWIAAQRESGNRQISMLGHRKIVLREIQKLTGSWPNPDEAVERLSAVGAVDKVLADKIRCDIESLKPKLKS